MTSRFEVVNELSFDVMMGLIPVKPPPPSWAMIFLVAGGAVLLVAHRVAVWIVAQKLLSKLSPRLVS
jgi:hypothetical protein